MAKHDKVMEKILLSGSDANTAFEDFR